MACFKVMIKKRENKMKKIIATILVLLLASCFMLVSCTDNDDNGGLDKENDCKIESESVWNEIFARGLSNYTLEVVVYEEPNIVQITETVIYYKDVGYMQMYAVKSGDSYDAYAKLDGSDRYVWLIDKEANELVDYVTEQSTVNIGAFINQYDKFTYDSEKKAYFCSEEIQLQMGGEIELNCFDISIVFKNDAIYEIDCKYEIADQEASEGPYTLKITNAGCTNVVVPQEVIDEAKDSSMPS